MKKKPFHAHVEKRIQEMRKRRKKFRQTELAKEKKLKKALNEENKNDRYRTTVIHC